MKYYGYLEQDDIITSDCEMYDDVVGWKAVRSGIGFVYNPEYMVMIRKPIPPNKIKE